MRSLAQFSMINLEAKISNWDN